MIYMMGRLALKNPEARLFLLGFSTELVFALLLLARWGMTFCTGDATCHEYLVKLVLASGDIRHLGTHWLPLLHILMLPLVRLDFLYTTRLAGALVNSVATGLLCVYLYKLIGDRGAGLAAPIILMCNAYTLIFGATPMTEQLAALLIVASAYHIRRYLTSKRLSEFLKASAFLVAGSLTRYEIWLVAGLASLALLLVELRRRNLRALLALPLPLTGVLAWLAWNYYITLSYYGQGNPLYFMTGHGFYAKVYLTLVSPLRQLSVALAMVFAVSGVMLGPSLLMLKRWLSERDYVGFFVGFLLLSHMFIHLALVLARLSFGWARYFYPSLPGMIFCSYRFYERGLKMSKLPAQTALKTMLKRLFPLVILAYPVHGFLLATGYLPDICFNELSQYRQEFAQMAQVIGDGRVLIGPHANIWFAVLTGMDPSQIVDGYDGELFIRAMERPWDYVDFVIVEKKLKDDPLLQGLNEVFHGKFYVYRLYHDEAWRADFLAHFELVLETEHFLLYGLKAHEAKVN